MKMRGIYSSVTDIRRKVFTEVARLAYEEGDYAEKIAELPYKIVPGSKAVYRESIFLERAIVEERLRLAIGLPLRLWLTALKKVRSQKSITIHRL